VLRSRSFTYDEMFKSENAIEAVEDAEREKDGDWERRFVDGDVDEIRLETGLLLIFVLAFGFVELSAVVVEGEAVDGDDVDRTDGEEDEDGCTRNSC
jgi:hypothetical protein